MVNVQKADGTTQPFDRNKVLSTCHRLKLSPQESEEVVREIESKIFEGIPTKSIIDMIFQHGKRHRAHFEHMIDIREALSLMRSKPDFEKFVALILQHEGYTVQTNVILQGRCVDHEIDVIAVKGSEVIYVEVKHHNQFHTYSGLDTFLEVNSSFQDLVEGNAIGKNRYAFTKPLLVVNTKLSDHAKRYSTCRGISSIGWKMPEGGGIERHIDEKYLYPVTVIKDIDFDTLSRLGDNGVYTLKQLVQVHIPEFSQRSGIREHVLVNIMDKASSILSS